MFITAAADNPLSIFSPSFSKQINFTSAPPPTLPPNTRVPAKVSHPYLSSAREEERSVSLTACLPARQPHSSVLNPSIPRSQGSPSENSTSRRVARGNTFRSQKKKKRGEGVEKKLFFPLVYLLSGPLLLSFLEKKKYPWQHSDREATHPEV